jgi:hypothetical protein
MLVRLHATITAMLAVFALAAIVLASSSPTAAREEIRYVPQLELSDLQPVQVSFRPDDETLLLVVNEHGRIDLFDLSNPGRPSKITEIATNAIAAAFTPTPKRIPREDIKIVSRPD